MFTLGAGKTLAASGPTAVNFFVFGDAVTTTDAFDILAKGSVSVAATTIYTATGVQGLVKTLVLFNTAGTGSAVFLYANGTATTDRFFSATIPAGGTLTYGNAGWQVTDATGAILASSTPITASGDVTGTQVGTNIALTLATFGPGAVGPIGSATQVAAVSTDAKGRVSALSAVSIQIAESQVTGLGADLTARALTSTTVTATAPITGSGSLGANLIIGISAATATTAGSLSAAGFKKLAGYYDMVADWGFVGDDATDNLAAWVAFKAAIPNNSICYFPPGTYRFSAEATLDQDKHLQFHGAGANVSTLKIMAAAANLINITGAGANAWYNTFSDLGFSSGVTKTAGAHIAINVATAIGIDIRRCVFAGHFIGIDAQGAQAGNVSVWDSIQMGAPAVNGRGIRINGSVINLTLMNSTINGVPNAGAIAGSANVEINQSGSVQIMGCDFIGAVNSLLLNANQGGGTSIAAVYITNTFFDQSGGSTIKIAGGNTTNRVKFTQCGIAAGLIGTHAFEVAGTGAGAVGTATAMPAGISLVDCDIYYAPGASTASGIHVNGCQDINIQDTRIAGFSGTGGAGLHVIASAANQTRVRANGCRIGPNSNLTINNLVGIQLDAGASALGALTITDNDIGGNGTAIVDSSTIVSSNSKVINNNVGAMSGMSSSLASAAGFALSTTEQVAVILPLPANAAKVGTTFRFMVTGTAIATVTTTARLHIGTAGSVADAQIVTTAVSAAGVAGGFVVSGLVTITAVGATGTGQGAIMIQTGTATSAPAITATGTFNSTIANFVTVGLLCSAAGHTVRAATIEIVSPS